MFQILITKTAIQTFPFIAILFLQLYQCLTIRRTDNRKPGIAPRADNMIALRLQFFQKASGTFTHSFICLMQTVCIKKRNHCINDNQILGTLSQRFLLLRRKSPEQIMILPIGRRTCIQQSSHIRQRFRFQQT